MRRSHKILTLIATPIIALTIIACGASSDDKAASPASTVSTVSEQPQATKAPAKPKVITKAAPKLSVEEQNAVKAAENYLSTMPFSRKGLIKQLSSDAGSGYPVKAATKAVDSLKVNYNDQAAKAAENYLSTMPFSRKDLIKQLESDAGDGYTHAQAVYGVKKAGL